MDNQTNNTENAWVDGKIASLAPPVDWHPNTNRAYAQFLNRRDTDVPKAGASWIRLSMAAAILASISLVLTLLPWHGIWKPAAKNAEIRMEAPRTVTAPTMVPEPLRQQTALPPLPQPLLSQPAVSQPALSQPALSQPTLSQPALSQPALSQPQSPGPGTGAGIPLTAALTAQEPEQKPAVRVGPKATPPRLVLQTEPGYTDEARRDHVQGAVILNVTVRADGTGKVDKVAQGLGSGLDEKAIEAFESWRFEPGTLDGKPVSVSLQVTINFHLY